MSDRRDMQKEHAPVQDETSTPTPEAASPTRGWRGRRAAWASLAVIAMLTLLTMITGRFDTLAHGLLRMFDVEAPAEEPLETVAEAPAPTEAGTFAFADLDIHPDVLYGPYTAGQLLTSDFSSSSSEMISAFRELLSLYVQRQGEDDNFTIRVVDNRTDELLELFVLEDERQKYEQREPGETWNWGRIDGLRRTWTRELVNKYASRGIPRAAITVKWGRANQVREAREREMPFIEYEIRLARYLGLSLLATEIGTVETFNQDQLVSPVGARSRYQMMPYVLRQQDVHHYELPTVAGNRVNVYEEWHPLLTMEASFRTLAGYVNAVGHEIPGISAYHTGPGNIYMLYRMFLTESDNLASASVVDAYIWAVTSGFGSVSRNSSFRTYSRGYVAAAYGSLRATESLPIDTTQTLLADRVQLRAGEQVMLSDLLSALGEAGATLDWGPGTQGEALYDRFRTLNPHFVLPRVPDMENGGPNLPPHANVKLVSSVHDTPVRFFLPIGALKIIKQRGLDVFDEDATFRFDHNTFGTPLPSEVTIWDRQYQELIRDIADFGFTRENKQRLFSLTNRFEELAAANPTHYRKTQLDVIRTHKYLWMTNGWERVANTVAAVRGQLRMEARPPSPLQPALQPLSLSGSVLQP